MRFFPREKGETAFVEGFSLTKAVFPFSHGKNRISQGVENRGSLISVPLAHRVLSHLASLWGGTPKVAFESPLGYFNSFCVSVELGARPLHNSKGKSTAPRQQEPRVFRHKHASAKSMREAKEGEEGRKEGREEGRQVRFDCFNISGPLGPHVLSRRLGSNFDLRVVFPLTEPRKPPGRKSQKNGEKLQNSPPRSNPRKWGKITEKLPKNVFSGSIFLVIFRYFRGLDRGGEFCNFSPFFGDFRPGGFRGSVRGKTTRKF